MSATPAAFDTTPLPTLHYAPATSEPTLDDDPCQPLQRKPVRGSDRRCPYWTWDGRVWQSSRAERYTYVTQCYLPPDASERTPPLPQPVKAGV